ncbi:MAG TPA: hypothetical protein VEZ48_07245 [Sphingomonadaceae bacterium]|nr:hypothetical protein [Sphingomonadaceae bacterium]
MRVLILILLLGGCATVPAPEPADAFFARLGSLCGKAYAGRVVSTDAADADMRGKPLVMHVRECSAEAIRIPFHVGADRSRTWVVTRTAGGLRLKHDHRHADGGEDVLTQYGGDSAGGTAVRQSFPADAFSQALFRDKGNPASVTNVWAMELRPGRTFAYELRRPGRFFRVEFDLSAPVAAPPPPWGAR